MLRLVENTGLRPVIDRVIPLSEAASGLAAMTAGDLFGKIVLEP